MIPPGDVAEAVAPGTSCLMSAALTFLDADADPTVLPFRVLELFTDPTPAPVVPCDLDLLSALATFLTGLGRGPQRGGTGGLSADEDAGLTRLVSPKEWRADWLMPPTEGV